MPAITPLPTPPSTSDPANFATEADAFLGALPTLATEINAFGAALNSLSTTSTSTTSNTIGTGSKSFTVQTGKSYAEGQSLTIARTAAPTNRMFAAVDSYDSGTGALVVTSQAFAGSGTFTDWTITLSFNGVITTEQIQDLAVTEAKLAAALLRKLTKSRLQDVDAAVAGNDLTVTINPGTWDFRSTTLTDGTPTEVTLSSPVTVVVPNGATLGTINGQAARIPVLAINNGGAIEAAVVNLAGGNQLDETNLITTTTIGTGADSNNVIYSTTGRTNVAYRVVGFIDITEATAGTWATAPTLVQGIGGQALAALSSLGYGQTWQDFTGSRAQLTTYYNTTGKPIEVAITGISGATTSGFTATVNGVVVFTNSTSDGTVGSTIGGMFLVPVGQSYSVQFFGGAASSWKELR